MENTLILDTGTSIVLPYFDTSSIVNSNINSIILSLYVLDKIPNTSNKIHVTINPVDLNTKIIEDGLSTYIDLEKKNYFDLKLPKELFEKTIRTQKRLLLRLIDGTEKLILQGSDMLGTTQDPKLLIQYDQLGPDEILDQPRIINFKFFNINNNQFMGNSQFHFGKGDNVGRDKIEQEKVSTKNWYEKPPGIIFLTLATGLMLAFLIYQFGWN